MRSQLLVSHMHFGAWAQCLALIVMSAKNLICSGVALWNEKDSLTRLGEKLIFN